MQSFLNRILRQPLLVLLAGVALLFASHGASASSCSGGGGTYDVSAPATVTVGRDVPIGGVIMPWKSSGSASWSCYASAPEGYRTDAYPSISGSSSGRYISGPDGSGSYIVKPTNVPGVGIAIAEYTYISSSVCVGGIWRDVFAPGPSGGAGSGCAMSSSSDSGSLSLQAAVALVKLGPITAGAIPAQQVAYATTQNQNYSGGGYYQNGGGTAYYRIPAVSVAEVSCEVADVDVLLGTHSPAAFTGIGTKVGVTDFVINVQNCPAGMNTVKYRLELAPGVSAITPASGIVALDATSTATGVGVQITDRSNVAYNLSTMPWKTVTLTYAPATGGNYTIPLRAAYYQTAATVTPGAANSAVMFTMQYL